MKKTETKDLVAVEAEKNESQAHIIYELESSSIFDFVLTLACFEAMSESGYSIGVNPETHGMLFKVVIDTLTEKVNDRKVECAIFLGLTEATRRKIDVMQIDDVIDYKIQAKQVASELLQDLTDKPEFLVEINRYYGGLRWSLDQERFVRALFEHGTSFDPEFLDENLTGNHLNTLVYNLDAAISYDQRRDWYSLKPMEIFSKFPEIDYHKLQDSEFRETEAGQKLLVEYAKLSGWIMSEQNKKSLYNAPTRAGIDIVRPLIPLSHHPIIETLIADELATDKPRPKYFFGPSDLTALVLDSDSRLAHRSLVTSIINRLPKDDRNVFDGPNEFQHKRSTIQSVLWAYHESVGDQLRLEILREDLVRIIEEFTGETEIITSVRKENEAYRERSRRWSTDGTPSNLSEVYEIKNIIRYLIQYGVISPDLEIISRVEEVIG